MADDYDSTWKEVLDRFLPDCLTVLFPEVHALIDWSRRYRILKPDLPLPAAHAGTSKRAVDLLVKVWLLDGRRETLYLHVEAQGRYEEDFARRIFAYWMRVAVRYSTLPLTLVIFTYDGNPKWKPDKFDFQFAGLELAFKYPAVKLSDWEARRAELEADERVFAAFILAHLDTRKTAGNPEGRAVRKLALMKNLVRRAIPTQDIRDMLKFVDWLVLVPEDVFEPYYNDYKAFVRENAVPYVSTFEILERKQGEVIGLRRGLKLALGIKFGKPGLAFASKLKTVDDLAKLNALEKSLPNATGIDELKKLLD